MFYHLFPEEIYKTQSPAAKQAKDTTYPNCHLSTYQLINC